MVTFAPFTTKNIPFLHNRDTLYIADFRGLAEDLTYEIPAYIKYENYLAPFKLENVVVNADVQKVFHRGTHLIQAPIAKDARITVLERLADRFPLKGISKLWQAVPHPVSDVYSKRMGLKSYDNYEAFLYRNHKAVQKTLCEGLTPPWHYISENFLTDRPSYIKHIHGSGGFRNLRTTEDTIDLPSLTRNAHTWYVEEEVEGIAHSAQCFSYEGNVAIFSWGKQHIEAKKHFSGADIFSVESISQQIEVFLRQVVERLEPLIKDYTGFWGIDFMIENNSNRLLFLEANLRTTTLSFPSLLASELNFQKPVFLEEVSKETAEKNAVIIGMYDNTVDILLDRAK